MPPFLLRTYVVAKIFQKKNGRARFATAASDNGHKNKFLGRHRGRKTIIPRIVPQK